MVGINVFNGLFLFSEQFFFHEKQSTILHIYTVHSPLMLQVLLATKLELRDHMYLETTFEESLRWSLNTGLTIY